MAMETVTRFPERPISAAPSSTQTPEVARTLSVIAAYVLSEEGRKASLLVGGDGRAVQQITLHVPLNRLHLVSVDRDGIARLKLRPRFELDPTHKVIRTDASPLFDAPPTVDDLYRAAAKNHELERAYHAERSGERTKRLELEREFRDRAAEAFLADTAQRAVAHPPPSPIRCCLVTERGRVFFDVATNQGRAKDVPPEAHRRFRADVRAKQERNRHDRAAQLAVHEEKVRFIAQWIEQHGTNEQKSRNAAGVLPMAEAVEAIADQVFAPLGERPRYIRDGAERIRRPRTQRSDDANDTVRTGDLVVTSEHAKTATATQWAIVQEFRSCLPNAAVMLRTHRISHRRDSSARTVIFGVLVTLKHGPFTLRREFEV
jgi:hypothetical protein